MASSDTKSGFRLPWSSDRSHDDPAGELPEEGNQEGDTPASEDVAWPDSSIHDRLGISTNGQRPPEADETASVPSEESQRMVETEAPAPSTPATPRKQPTKLMADLSAAIRATAEAARDGALAQLDADARQVTDSIRERSTEGGTVLRKRSDDDIAGIRDWSKAEIARIREETDTRIASRKSELERELAAHAAAVDNRVEEVQGEVERFRSDMAEYFDRLDNEADPARLATMVEAMPDPPSFEFWTDIEFISAATSVAEEHVVEDETPAAEAVAEVEPEAMATGVAEAETEAESETGAPDGMAEAEVEATAATGEVELEAEAAVEAETPEAVDETADATVEAEVAEVAEATADATVEAEGDAVGMAETEANAAEDGATRAPVSWGEDEGDWKTSGDGAPRWESGDAPEGFPGGDQGGDPVDRGAIMAALEAAAEAVVAAEAAAESADQAEAAADVAETAAGLLVGRNSSEDEALDSEAQAALDARVDAGGFEESYADRLASLLPPPPDENGLEPRTTQVIVAGLVSVASIASFKRHLARLTGVQTVAVASGPEGEFVFNVTHRADVSFKDAIPTMPGFAARVTSTSDGVVNVTARDPETEG